MIKLLRILFFAFEDFYSKWIVDDESFDPTWMSLDKWKESRTT